MKRFLNHLRFAAAAPEAALPGGVLVGLGVFALVDVDLVRSFASGGRDLLAAAQERIGTEAVWGTICDTADRGNLRRSELPEFNPRQEDAAQFLGLWEGVRVQA